MRVGVLIRSYHATEYLRSVIKSYYWVDQIVVLNYRFNCVKEVSDDTEEICKSLNFKNLYYEKGCGLKQNEIFERGLFLLRECEFTFIADADEFIIPTDQRKIVNEMEREGYDAGYCKIRDYFYDPYHCMPERKHPTLVIVRTSKAKFSRIRNIDTNELKIKFFPITLHHFGFALSREKLEWKIEWESREEEVNISGYIRTMPIATCRPKPEILEMLNEDRGYC